MIGSKREKHVGKCWTIATRPFGYAMYPTDAWMDGNGNIGWTDRLDEALIFDSRDNQEIKLAFYTGLVRMYFGEAATVETMPCAS